MDLSDKQKQLLAGAHQRAIIDACRKTFERGREIAEIGAPGLIWQIESGAVRLDNDFPRSELSFVSISIPGDVVGFEQPEGGYALSAVALTDVSLIPWLPQFEMTNGKEWMSLMTQQDIRRSNVMNLRTGLAKDRISRLLKLINASVSDRKYSTPERWRASLPSLRDMAEMTALTIETVSRTLNRSDVHVPEKTEISRGLQLVQ